MFCNLKWNQYQRGLLLKVTRRHVGRPPCPPTLAQHTHYTIYKRDPEGNVAAVLEHAHMNAERLKIHNIPAYCGDIKHNLADTKY